MIQIKNDALTVSIAELGAELQSVRGADGTEYLWQGNPAFWSGRAPVLFPIVGKLRNEKAFINGKEYIIPRHGIVRRRVFAAERKSDTSVCFLTASDENTKCSYPFDFELRVSYTLDGPAIIQRFAITNKGDRDMPFVIGGHPAFNCPLLPGERFEDYDIMFERPETLSCPTVDISNGLIDMGTASRALRQEQSIPLSHSLFDSDALIFENTKSKTVSLLNRNTGRGVSLTYEGFRFLAVWSAVGNSPFVALEPWTGCATCNDESDLLEQKRGMYLLPPNQTHTVELRILVF